MSKQESKTQNLTLAGGPAYTPEQAAEMRERVERARVSGRDAVVEAARVSFAVKSLGMIGEGRVWATQGDYASALGVSPGLVSGLVALGTALDRGLTPEHPSFPVVYANRQSIGKAAADPKHKGFTHIVKAAKEAQAKKNAPRPVQSAQEPKKKTPDTSGVVGMWHALSFIRDGIGDLNDADTRTLLASLSGLMADAKEHLKTAPKGEATPDTATA